MSRDGEFSWIYFKKENVEKKEDKLGWMEGKKRKNLKINR